MTKRNRSLIWKLIALLLAGILAAKTDPWARANPDAYLDSAQLVSLIALFLFLLLQRSSGRLKSGPDRPTGADVVERIPAVSILSAGYLFLLAVTAVGFVLAGFRLDDHIASPLASYFVLAPFVLIQVWGKHKLDRDVQSENALHRPPR